MLHGEVREDDGRVRRWCQSATVIEVARRERSRGDHKTCGGDGDDDVRRRRGGGGGGARKECKKEASSLCEIFSLDYFNTKYLQ